MSVSSGAAIAAPVHALSACITKETVTFVFFDGDTTGELRKDLSGEDYTLLPEEAWHILHEWYGGGPAYPRRVIAVGKAQVLRVGMYHYRTIHTVHTLSLTVFIYCCDGAQKCIPCLLPSYKSDEAGQPSNPSLSHYARAAHVASLFVGDVCLSSHDNRDSGDDELPNHSR